MNTSYVFETLECNILAHKSGHNFSFSNIFGKKVKLSKSESEKNENMETNVVHYGSHQPSVSQPKVHRSKGRTLLIVYAQPSKNKLDRLRNKYICFHLHTGLYRTQPSYKKMICFDFEKQIMHYLQQCFSTFFALRHPCLII